MSKDYADSRFGVPQMFDTPVTAALNGTVGATELFRYRFDHAAALTGIGVRFSVGGTDAVRTIIAGKGTAGGAITAFGTQLLGTQANNTTKSLSITGNLEAGEELIIQQLGTGAQPYVVSFQPYYRERFVNA